MSATPGRPEDIRLLADDLTGALDSAAAFAGSVAVHLDRAPAARGGGIVAVATPTRDVATSTLPQRLAAVQDWFVSGALAFKKIDSLLRGNTYAECAHLARAGGFDGVVFAPAFPAQRRVTVGGRQQVIAPPGGDAAAPTPVGGHIVQAFAAHGLVAEVTGADEGPRAGVARSPSAPTVWVPDVRTEADLLQVARRALPGPSSLPGRWLWCGSAGLAHALARAMGAAAPAPRSEADGPEPGPAGAAQGVLVLGASHHEVVRRQWAWLRQAWPSALHVAEGDERQFAQACEAMRGPFGVAAMELSPRRALTAAQAADLLQRQLDALVGSIARPSRLLVVGGDTLLATCRATGVTHLQTQPARRPGWGHARLVGGRWDGVPCHSRSGAFGDERDLDAMLRRVGPAVAS